MEIITLENKLKMNIFMFETQTATSDLTCETFIPKSDQ